MKKIFLLFMGVLLSSFAMAQTKTATATNKATATLAVSCKIGVQNVSFGALVLPVTTQQATSNMTVLCTKSSAYTISMGTMSSVYILIMNGNGHYYAYNSATGTAGDWGNYDVSQAGCSDLNDCVTNKGYTLYSSSVPGGTMGCNYSSCTVYTSVSGFSGTMKGAAKGDTVAYKIKHPTTGNPWNSTNTYAGSGTGTTQNVPVLAELIPASTRAFPAPDSYSDTVTSVINF